MTRRIFLPGDSLKQNFIFGYLIPIMIMDLIPDNGAKIGVTLPGGRCGRPWFPLRLSATCHRIGCRADHFSSQLNEFSEGFV
jgi:hypothetical protein